MSSRCISCFMTSGSSFTPLSSTVWQPERNAGVGQAAEARDRGRGQLVRVVEVRVDEERVEALEHRRTARA